MQLGPQHASRLYERFESHHGVRGVVVVQGETNCWPFMDDEMYGPGHCAPECCSWRVTKCDEMNPTNSTFLAGKPTNYLYLNSGSIVTRAGSLGLLADFVISLTQSIPLKCYQRGDQALLSALFRFQDKFKPPVSSMIDPCHCKQRPFNAGGRSQCGRLRSAEPARYT